MFGIRFEVIGTINCSDLFDGSNINSYTKSDGCYMTAVPKDYIKMEDMCRTMKLNYEIAKKSEGFFD